MQSGRPAVDPFEDRLRNLILAGSGPEAMPDLKSSNEAAFTSASHSAHISQDKEEFRDGQGYPNTMRPTPKGGKKRPNQAQRRQMNAELSIPIDIGAHDHPSSRPLQNGQQQNSFSSRTSGFPVKFQDQSWSGGSHSNGQSRQGYAQHSTSSTHQSDWRRQQHPNFESLSRGVNIIPADAFSSRGGRHPTQSQSALYNPGGYRQLGLGPEQLANQSTFLDRLCYQIITGAEIGPEEIAEKEKFRTYVEAICRHVVTCYEHEVNGARKFQPEDVELKCFGSLASGFATKAADMDLGLLSPMSRLSPGSPESPVPRLIEGALLAAGFGARLLTKTRVPIIKLCEKPNTALRQGLLEARKKWENGVDHEERELDDDVPEDPDFPLDINIPIDTELNRAPTIIQMPQPSLDAKAASPHEEEFLLKQSSNQPLSSYYGNAKRLLRRLNSRDITYSNSKDFTEANFILLDKVASAFARGLYNANLRSRILAYPSFYIGDTTQLTNYRSLLGVNTIIEGEKLVLLWESRQLSGNPKADQAYESVIQQWKDLQYSKNFGTNPLWFNKELQLAVDAIRRIPCVQIMQLRQDQHESPHQYHGRANKIATALAGTSFPGADIPGYIIQNYVNGIRDEEIRNEVHDFAALTGTQVLRTVARKHKSLHLAADYEKAIEQGLYRPEDLPILQSYITILRHKPVHSLQRPKDFEYLIPIMQNELCVLNSIRELPDPATLSPNKPKDKYSDALEFPKSGVGVQCDINFSAHLALQNTSLLRCYSHTDPRVRPLVLFVKHWAKARGVNTPYRGTLSSYGYVLMVLHYLVNVVEPFVCPNLQELAPPDPNLPPDALEGITTCQGHNVRFWRDEGAIRSLAQQGQLNQNHDSLGTLLRGFFEYYAQSNMMTALSKKGFDWGRDVISLRTHDGLLSKAEKRWTEAKTVIQPQTGASPASTELDSTAMHSPSLSSSNTTSQAGANQPLSPDRGARPVTEHQTPKPKEVKEVRHRFLFAIEDPFELDHNVARTVTHNGIVAIRDEFRRAWRIIKLAGKGPVIEDLLEDVKVRKGELDKRQFMALLDEIHGDEIFGIQG
ncbi:hypothetical protein E0Z10_g2072 [Xylaria hypoxylon]|uniref:polynucleotide adenylyltransferase n=1 Tax=Xylaria hypoxylon TaxID=37992 RepID=A0A4Z0ZDC4_9PEZI|nr:hypothetical protein E0Z10_g2072 [Xylaria hypoxylon]